MKLTLEHLSPYLPYGLKWTLQEVKQFTMTGITRETLYTNEGAVLIWVKQPNLPQALFPILRPLSDYKDINSKAMSDLNCDLSDQIDLCDLANKHTNIEGVRYQLASICFEHHIDVFGLIEKGLAININEI